MKPLNTEDFVYSKLKDAIFKRHIRPNVRLIESKIADQLKVSRTPVRGAIKRLAHEGFVKFSNNRGASIVKPTIKEIIDTFAVRAQLEKMAAAKAIEQLTGEDIVTFELLLDEENKIFEDRDIGVYYNLNYDFHIHMATITKNLILKEYLSSIINRSHIYLILYENFYQLEYNPSYAEHQALVEALKEKNVHKSKEAIDSHIKSTIGGLRLDELDKDFYNEELMI